MKRELKLLKFDTLNILHQLQIEEALLRTSSDNFCILNSGSSDATVLGISSPEEELVNFELLQKRPMPLIRRFSGGGTVLVDHDTLFFTLIMNQEVANVALFPKNIMAWNGDFVQKALNISNLEVKESDYVIGDKKIAGNAQHIGKNRWLQHTSFLFDFCKEKMNLLHHPKKQPSYRQQRDHTTFLSPLKNHIATKELFFERLISHLSTQFNVSAMTEQETQKALQTPHRQATKIITER